MIKSGDLVCVLKVADGTLDITTSKNETGAVFDVTAYPLFMLALQAVPAAERTGPLVVDEEGVPLRRRNYQNLYRDVANAAGVPRTVWNMFARHGAVRNRCGEPPFAPLPRSKRCRCRL
jgi:hypothetical protein